MSARTLNTIAAELATIARYTDDMSLQAKASLNRIAAELTDHDAAVRDFVEASGLEVKP